MGISGKKKERKLRTKRKRGKKEKCYERKKDEGKEKVMNE